MATILRYFTWITGTPEQSAEIQRVQKMFEDLAYDLEHSKLLSGDEKSAGLRKLLEAKDCFVRAAL